MKRFPAPLNSLVHSSAWVWCWWVLSLGVLLVGCGGQSRFEVDRGRYRVYLKGTLTDTLRGAAFYRSHANQDVGIELGERGSPGLSITLGPKPLSSRSYKVVGGKLLEESKSPKVTGASAFLATREFQFEATRGTLSVIRVTKEEIVGSVHFEMRGTTADRRRRPSIRVTGLFWAIEK